MTRSQYDSVSRLTWRKQEYAPVDGELYTTLGYNPAGQIVTQQRSNHEYVITGQADIARGYAVNGLNQYTQVGGVAQTHDANGNLVSDGATTFGGACPGRRPGGAENRLISATGARTATLAYDPLGRLWRVAGASTDTRVLGACPGLRPGDGDQLAAEYDAAGTLLRRYAWGPEVDEPVLWDEGGALNCSGAHLLMGDHQGSVVGFAQCSGALLTVNRYDDWGTPDATNVGRFQYTGQAWLPELGLYHYKARLYSPALGRFLQVDPVGYDDQINLYAYVGNDPVNGRDPTGKCPWCVGALIGTATEGAMLYVVIRGGGRVSLGEGVVRVAVSAGAGALGVGLGAKAGEALKLTSLAAKTIPAGNEGVKVGTALAAGVRGAASGATAAGTSHVVGEGAKSAGGLGDGPTARSAVQATGLGAVTGGFTGAVAGSAAGAAAAGEVSPSAARSVSTQSAIVSEMPGVVQATIPQRRECTGEGNRC